MPVSIYGQCPDMDAVNTIAQKYKLPVIEDAAQSFGATYKGKKSCNLSTVGSTSFFPSKPLGCYGDAGALLRMMMKLRKNFVGFVFTDKNESIIIQFLELTVGWIPFRPLFFLLSSRFSPMKFPRGLR